jgi:hypothetical protein
MSNSNQQLFKRIDAILDGIDRQEDDPRGGWWHTEDGARVGRIKLGELKEAIQEHLITVAGTACAGAAKPKPFPVDLADLHDPGFSAGLSTSERLTYAWGLAPNPSPFPTGKSAGRRLPVHESCPANGCSACRDHLPCARLEPLKQVAPAPVLPEPFPVDLVALHDPDFSDGLSPIEHLNRLSGVAPAPVLPEPSTRDDLDNLCGPPTLKDVEATSAQPAAIAQPAEADQLTPKEVQAQECFTALRDEILNLNDGLEVNEVLHIIDNHTPDWV